MGCDIHMYREAKKHSLKDGTCWCDVSLYRRSSWSEGFYVREKFDGRSYDFFAILADVRNDGGVVPISEPKGLPDDVSESIKKESDDWGCDGHSHSYLTYRELLEYQMNHSSIIQKGMMTKEQAENLDKYGIKPSSWCGYTNSPDYVYREWKDNLPWAFTEIIKDIEECIVDEFHIFKKGHLCLGNWFGGAAFYFYFSDEPDGVYKTAIRNGLGAIIGYKEYYEDFSYGKYGKIEFD